MLSAADCCNGTLMGYSVFVGRTFLPPPEYNPLAPTSAPEHPTELPRGTSDLAVFANRFPGLTLDAPEPEGGPAHTCTGVGACEVVVRDEQRPPSREGQQMVERRPF